MTFTPRIRVLGHAFVVSFLLVSLAPLTSCDQRPPDLGPYILSAQTNPANASASLATDWRAGRLTFEDALNGAHDLLDADDPRGVGFSEAVLRFALMIEDELPHGGEHEIFWRRIGRLAFKGSYLAFQNDDLASAESIVLSGPDRWRTDAYFWRYDDHNALASVILNNAGKRREAIDRLRRQPALGTEAQGVLDALGG